jgi:cysteine sulfinate desulfinase/cysteine desulfurase-like protein
MYLDMQATTPLDPRVLDAMLPYMVDQVGLLWQLYCTPRLFQNANWPAGAAAAGAAAKAA